MRLRAHAREADRRDPIAFTKAGVEAPVREEAGYTQAEACVSGHHDLPVRLESCRHRSPLPSGEVDDYPSAPSEGCIELAAVQEPPDLHLVTVAPGDDDLPIRLDEDCALPAPVFLLRGDPTISAETGVEVSRDLIGGAGGRGQSNREEQQQKRGHERPSPD